MSTAQTSRLAALNDAFRMSFLGGEILLTQSINGLPENEKREILHAVQSFNAFTPDNDPYEAHDFGAFTHNDKRIFWKIDYYDPSMAFGSENPDNPSQTVRVLTIMLASDY